MRSLCILLLLGLGGSSAAAGKPKIAALILKSGAVDEELADNLTEVMIARLARRGDHEIAGKEELKAKLGVDEKTAAGCLENLGCLGRVGTELGVTRMVVGTLGRRGVDYLYNLSLIDIGTGRVENRVFELVAGGKVEGVISAVSATLDKLFLPKVEPGALKIASETRGAMCYLDDVFIGMPPVRRDGIEPGLHTLRVEKEGHIGWRKEIEVPAGSTLQVKVPLTALPERRKWPGQLATGFVVLGALSGAVGIVLMAIASDAPLNSTVTRQEALDSADRRFIMNRIGQGGLLAAAALAVTAGILTLAYRRDIFETKVKVTAGLAPTQDGVAAAAMVRW
jgi:hypothetical protein